MVRLIRLYQLLRQNAPSVYATVCHRKVQELTENLDLLRTYYKTAPQEEKEGLTKKAKEIKVLLGELLPDTAVVPTANT